MELKGKTIVLTGASSGIGCSLAEEFGRQGARVTLMARREDLLSDVAQAVRKAGGEALVAPGDVANQADVQRVVTETVREFGQVDILVANAGMGMPTPATRLDPAVVQQMMQVNFMGVVYATAAVLPDMLQRKSGYITAVSSLAGWRGLPTSAGYSATKAALSAFLEGLRVELKPKGIVVSTIHPGFVRTPMTAKNTFPMPFMVEPETAARTIVFGMKSERSEINFPLPMAQLMRVVRRLPNIVFDAALGKASKGQLK